MGKNKRILAFLLALVLCISLVPTMALASDSSSSDIAIVAPATAAVGDTVTVTIQTSKAIDLYSITGGVQFDTSKLSFQSITLNLDKTKAVPSGSADAALNTTEKNKVGFYFLHGNTEAYHLNANTTIATIKFKVLGSGTITLQGYEDTDLSSGTDVQISADSGTITASIEVACSHANVTKTAAADADCTTAGNSTYWYCSDCGKYFSDAACSTEVTKDSVIIAALGHNYTSVVTNPTYSSQGYTTYTCTRCGDTYVGDYTDKLVKISAPTISGLTSSGNGVTVSWGAVTGASQYRVFYKADGGSWARAGVTSSTSLEVTGLTSGTTYSFTVRCLDVNGDYADTGSSGAKSITYIAAPTIGGVSRSTTGISLRWDVVKGATYYRVYYKTEGGKWITYKDITSNSVTVTGLTSGTRYTFTVRCVDSSGNSVSAYNGTGRSITYYAAPEISSLTNGGNGVTVTWGAVTGASQYRVFCKCPDGTWKTVGDTTSTSLCATGLTSGSSYGFTVRSMDSNGNYIDGGSRPVKTITYIAAPTITGLSRLSGGASIHWEAVNGASYYRVYYKTEGGKWINAGVTSSTRMNITGLTKGVRYTFTVRCVDKSGNSISGYNGTGRSMTIQ